jgi:hypothetical protein
MASSHKLSTRIGDHWLLLTHMNERTWRLQVWGDTPLEAEVIADNEADAKETAVAATMERLNIEPDEPGFERLPHWNTAITSRWESRV